MSAVRLHPIRWADLDFPGFWEVELTDALGHTWTIVDKVPVLADEEWSSPDLPAELWFPCEVLNEPDEAGSVRISLACGVESVDGTGVFRVAADRVRPE